jgi:hypothetical protein
MMIWTLLDSHFNPDMLGTIPMMLSEMDPRPARVQLHEGYGHGGGWNPFKGFKLLPGDALQYPGDPVLAPLAQTKLRDELIVVYDYAWVAIIQLDRTFEVCRMD